jgi:hypothetical protein
LRVYEDYPEDTEFPFPTNQYICYDDMETLNDRFDATTTLKYPLRACSKRGMLRQGGSAQGRDNFLKDIEDAKEWADGDLPVLEWSDALYASAYRFLEDLDGCHVNPDQIINDQHTHFYIDALANYDDH